MRGAGSSLINPRFGKLFAFLGYFLLPFKGGAPNSVCAPPPTNHPSLPALQEIQYRDTSDDIASSQRRGRSRGEVKPGGQTARTWHSSPLKLSLLAKGGRHPFQLTRQGEIGARQPKWAMPLSVCSKCWPHENFHFILVRYSNFYASQHTRRAERTWEITKHITYNKEKNKRI